MLLGRLCGLKRLSRGLSYGSDSHVGFGPGFLRHCLGLLWVPTILCSFQPCWELNTQPHARAVLPATPATASRASFFRSAHLCKFESPPGTLRREASLIPFWGGLGFTHQKFQSTFTVLHQGFPNTTFDTLCSLHSGSHGFISCSPELPECPKHGVVTGVSTDESTDEGARDWAAKARTESGERRALGGGTNKQLYFTAGSTVTSLPHYLHLLIEVESLRFPFSVLLLSNYIYHIRGWLCLLF